MDRVYVAIDLKSFYASVECVERGMDPLTTNLVVADASRTEKTICLAVSPSLKAYGIPGRARLFEVVQRVKEVNAERSRNHEEPLEYITAPPRMHTYMRYSTEIYNIYLSYIAPEDIHVYSVDEVFMDVTDYLKTYKTTAHDLAMKMVRDVLSKTGITATAGIGTNLYLCKIAMDIVAKHTEADKDGVRIAELDEMSYRKILWNHTPITDFWRVGRGYAKRLSEVGLYTMGDIAKCSVGKPQDFYNEDLLYKLFGINAELLIDHAWGWEPCTIKEIKEYKPSTTSLSSGQVLHCPYNYEKAKLIVREMTDLLILNLVEKGFKTDQMVLTVGYDIDNLTDKNIKDKYEGPIEHDGYGRPIPKQAHGSINIGEFSSSTTKITEAVMTLYDKIVNPLLLVRRMYVVANHLKSVREEDGTEYEQLDLFTDYDKVLSEREKEKEKAEKEKKLQEAVIELKKRFGSNAVLKGMNLEEGATTIDRNKQVGGHKA